MPLRVVFMGTPEFAVPALSAIAETDHRLIACYTQPPRPAGRGMAERRSPVHAKADELGVRVFTPATLRTDDEQRRFADLAADVAVVIAYGLLLPRAILDAPGLGCFNAHASLLPRWRGAAPIQRAIMAGDGETGVAIMKMDAGLDTGPVAMTERVAIEASMTAGELHDVLSQLSARLLVATLGALEAGALPLAAQPADGVTYAGKIDKSETRIDWARPAAQVHDHIRGLSPFPGAWCEFAAGGKAVRVKVLRSEIATGDGEPGQILDERDLRVACDGGAVRLLQVQRAGGKPVGAAEFLRGISLDPGQVLG